MKIVATQFMRFRQLVRLGRKIGLSSLIFFAIPTASVEAQIRLAQITPDESLPTTVEQLQEIMKINGGERAGNNLFHSFEEFSIPEGMEAMFENATDIENIFTRITGESISNIDGVLRTQGGANFFLVNPNGIIFGKNAQLDVGGSFIATTADSIQFEGGAEFVANSSISEPTITIDRPVGLAFGNSSGAITVNGTGSQITPSAIFKPASVEESNSKLASGLDQTLALVGGGINIESGTITTQGGQISLVSVESGQVAFKLSDGELTFDVEQIAGYQNIDLSEQTLLEAEGSNSAIQIIGKDLSLNTGSAILIQSRGDDSSKSLVVDVAGSFTLSGTAEDGNASSFIRTQTLGNGNGANISISTPNLTLSDGATIGTSTFAKGNAGNLIINADRSLQLLEAQTVNPSRRGLITSVISSATYGLGSGGDINISTSQLTNTAGGSITASTFGAASGGDLNIEADSIEVTGIQPQRFAPTSISASTSGEGTAGNLNLDASDLVVADGASINSASFSGDGGDVNIQADSIEITNGMNGSRSNISASVVTPNETIKRIFRITTEPTGNAGNLNIDTKNLQISQNGGIGVNNQGNGDAGLIVINAENTNLQNDARISANTASGRGGNINLSTDSLNLDDNSSITATAENDGNGGNVTINTTSLFAKKNSEITANAFAGTGGNIQIDTKGLFLFPDSTIEASSELGIDGTVEINTLDANLQKDLEISELNLIVDQDSLANSCLASRNSQRGSFVINNGNGLSTTGESGFYDSGSITGMGNSFSNLPVEQFSVTEPQSLENLTPAQQAVKTENGRIFLVSAPQSIKSLICN